MGNLGLKSAVGFEGGVGLYNKRARSTPMRFRSATSGLPSPTPARSPSDAAKWLGSFCSPVLNWSGLLLRRPIDMEKRNGIQRGSANLLDMRSYLFSRQCTLLIFLQRPWEVTHRALELLHNCVQELRLLEVRQVGRGRRRLPADPMAALNGSASPPASQVPVLEGALDCWVFLGCLEVLHRIENCCDRAQLDANSSHTVGLWAYATDKVTRRDALGQWPSWNRAFPPLPSCMRGLPSLKPWPLISPRCPCAQLKSLGQLCGLVSRTGPTSEDLNRTVDLLAGLGDERPETGRCSSAPWGVSIVRRVAHRRRGRGRHLERKVCGCGFHFKRLKSANRFVTCRNLI